MRKSIILSFMVVFSILILSIPLDVMGEFGRLSDQDKLDSTTIKYQIDKNVFSKDLERTLLTEDALASEHDVIIQFNRELSNEDLAILERLNINLRSRFRVLNGGAANVVGTDLLALAKYDFIKHIEVNAPMVRDMEMSLSVVNATLAWDSEIYRNGRYLGNIDGSGVTVCVVDTGIDAGHPDLDYGEKTLINLHDVGGGNFVEMENSDINYGHGTHVAGTVAGNGDASAGTRSGVAPGANLIGLSVSIPEQMTTPSVETYISGLEWVYENSRPENNVYNIRCATNSWHSSVGEYDPEAALSIIIEKISYDNNVITTWSAGNDGRDDPNGDIITTSQQGNTPVAIMVAAYERDGSAVTDFSSRGQVGLNHTYPDLGGPGRSIWSCAARRTLISGGSFVGGNDNPYYLAISGTSMSTPHIAGSVALLWQAAPSMKVSYIHEDYSGEDLSWWVNPRTLIHEVELILEASCTYLTPTEDHGVLAGEQSSLPGWNGEYADYVQGYGLVNVQKAVGIALALEELRTKYPNENITVFDAIENYERITKLEYLEQNTDVLTTQWSGEYSRFQGASGNPLTTVNQTKKVYIPSGAKNVNVDLIYAVVDREEKKAVDLAITIDFGDDGTVDFRGDLYRISQGIKNYEIPISGNDAQTWTFDIIGQGFKIQNPLDERNYVELRVDYDISVNIQFDSNSMQNFSRINSIYSELKFATPTQNPEISLSKPVHMYDLTEVEYTPPEDRTRPEKEMDYFNLVCFAGLFIVVLLLIAYFITKGKKQKKSIYE